jgi:hypothetical protein
MLHPSSGSKNKLFLLVSCSSYSSTLNMEVTCSSVTLVDFQWTTWHYIPEDRNLHNHHYENLISYIQLLLHLLAENKQYYKEYCKG